jgi:hypothetical protein
MVNVCSRFTPAIEEKPRTACARRPYRIGFAGQRGTIISWDDALLRFLVDQ